MKIQKLKAYLFIKFRPKIVLFWVNKLTEFVEIT